MVDPVTLLRAQYAVARSLAESGSLSEAAPSILREVCGALGWDVGVLWRVDSAGQALKFVDFYSRAGLRTGDFEAECRGRSFPVGVGLPGRVWKEGRPAWIPDVLKDENFPRAPFANEPGLHAAFAFPVRVNDHVVGVLEFFRGDVKAPDEALLHVMDGVGCQIGQYDARRRAEAELADAHARLARQHSELEEANRKLAELAVTDGLTGIANHRAFRTRLDTLVAEAARGRKFSLAMLDIDHFKKLNDLHGHPAGDEILRAIAHTLHDGVRRTDFVARYGGEEFAILLVDIEAARAAEISDVLRRRIAGIANPWKRVTASFGVADFAIGRNTAESLLAAADKALYKAKRNGRNRIEFTGEPAEAKVAKKKGKAPPTVGETLKRHERPRSEKRKTKSRKRKR